MGIKSPEKNKAEGPSCLEGLEVWRVPEGWRLQLEGSAWSPPPPHLGPPPIGTSPIRTLPIGALKLSIAAKVMWELISLRVR